MHSWREKNLISDITYLDQEPVMELLTFVFKCGIVLGEKKKGDISQ